MSSQKPWTVGPVTLKVRELSRVLEFYHTNLGLRELEREGSSVTLGAGDEPLLIFEHHPDAMRPPQHSTGLFHYAILLPSRLELARQLRHLVETRTPLQGMSDHLVSEAIYLADPEGNGIELYRDRPREDWTYEPNGQLHMTTDPLDVEGLLAEVRGDDEPFRAMPSGTIMGHVHLRVSDLAKAEAFYRDTLGFDVTTHYGSSAAFLSREGYHHHLGLNTWQSLGAPAPPENATGLKHFTLRLAGSEDAVAVRDPAGNTVVVQRV